MTIRSVVLACGLAGLAARLCGQADVDAICAQLGREPHEHPYLIFDAADKQEILGRIARDRSLSEVMEKVKLQGNRYLYATDEPPAPPRESHTRYVGSDEYRAYIIRHSQAAVTLAFLYQMTGERRYADRAFEHADRLCALDSWVQSPHRFDVIYPRVWPYGAKDDEVVFTYDITSAAVTRDLAYVYDWLYPALTKARRDRIRSGLLEKAITRVRGSYEYFWWAGASRCNWSGICHSGLGLAALTLLDEDPGLTDVIARSCHGVSSLLDHVDPDGGWQEGRGYWAYGMGESAYFIDALKRATGGQIDLFRHRAFMPHAADFALYGLTAGFGDGTGQPVGSSFFINKLVAETKDPVAAWYDRKFVRASEGVFDLIWPFPAGVRPAEPTEASKYFRGIDWAVLRKDFTPESVTVACKAGLNDDPHHGHLDCGTFNLTWRNVNFVGEAARSPYDEQYFGALRWEHLEAMTEAHNVVLVNGEKQICAKEKDEPWKTGIGGTILHYESRPDWGYVEMDPTHAYSGHDLKLWHRWIVLDKARGWVVVLDRVGSAPGARIEARFHPGVPVEVVSGQMVLHGGGGGERTAARAKRRAAPAAELGEHSFYSSTTPVLAGSGNADLVMIPLSLAGHELIQGREPDLPIMAEENFTWVPYFSTVAKAAAEETILAAVFIPGRGAKASLSGENGTWRINVKSPAGEVTYTFSEQKVERAAPNALGPE